MGIPYLGICPTEECKTWLEREVILHWLFREFSSSNSDLFRPQFTVDIEPFESKIEQVALFVKTDEEVQLMHL